MDLENLAKDIEKLLNNVVIKEKVDSLNGLKEGLLEKKKVIHSFVRLMKRKKRGKITNRFLGDLFRVENQFQQLYENFDDRLMIFVVGNGNVGKSTLLNALIGYEVAETNVLPTTWKIDVYSPQENMDTAVVKYTDGKKETLSVSQARELVKEEESKTKESKKTYNENLKKALTTLKTKEEREEMKRYLGEKHLYKSNVSEVRWPVKVNWLLEKCLLVDTPGLNQDLNQIGQLGDIHDYYHKADGILWVLDGQTIAAAKANTLLEELNQVLAGVGGVRDNIIGVINRMDLVRNNGGEDAVQKVISDAKAIFGDRFSTIVDISAKQALEGMESGILNLQNAIRDLFIEKSENIKNSAKEQGHNKLVNIALKKIEEYKGKLQEYESLLVTKEEKLTTLKEALKENFRRELQTFFDDYQKGVNERVERHIDALGEGQGTDFIKHTMYQLNEFESSRNSMLYNKKLEIKNNHYTWDKMARISEYKYIHNQDIVMGDMDMHIEFDLTSLNDIGYFTPYTDENLFSLVGNLFGKGMFFIRKAGIKSRIKLTMTKYCMELKETIMAELGRKIDESYEKCLEVLYTSFEDLLVAREDREAMKEALAILHKEMALEKEPITLKDILL